jgi:hypothetical protein
VSSRPGAWNLWRHNASAEDIGLLTVPDVLRKHNAFIFKCQASKKNVFVVETLVNSKPVMKTYLDSISRL